MPKASPRSSRARSFDVAELNQRLVHLQAALPTGDAPGPRPPAEPASTDAGRRRLHRPDPRHWDSRTTGRADPEGQPSRVPVVPRSCSWRRHHSYCSGLSQAADVEAASEVVPWSGTGSGSAIVKTSRPDARVPPVAPADRAASKYKGKLLLTKLGKAAQADPVALSRTSPTVSSTATRTPSRPRLDCWPFCALRLNRRDGTTSDWPKL